VQNDDVTRLRVVKELRRRSFDIAECSALRIARWEMKVAIHSRRHAFTLQRDDADAQRPEGFSVEGLSTGLLSVWYSGGTQSQRRDVIKPLFDLSERRLLNIH
jgi:hypothetical protein